MKTCNRCGMARPATAFYRNTKARDGRLSICEACVRARQKEYVAANKGAVAAGMKAYHSKHRDRLLAQQREYKATNKVRLAELKREKETGFSSALFAATFDHQGGLCPICASDLRCLPPTQVHADHCHISGLPRGVLCQGCNTALGKFGDSVRGLQKAIDYLMAPPVAAMKQKGYK